MKLKSLFAIAIIFTVLNTYGQKGRFVDKDPGIRIFESKIIKFLIDKQQFGGNYSPKDAEGRVYVRRELKLYNADLLLISFGSLGDHVWKYWGIIDKNNAFLFHYSSNGKDNHDDLISYLNQYDTNIRQVILNYIQTNAQEDYHEHEVVDEPNH